MKRETYCPETIKGLEMIPVANKTIILPFEEATYDELIMDNAAYPRIERSSESRCGDLPNYFPHA